MLLALLVSSIGTHSGAFTSLEAARRAHLAIRGPDSYANLEQRKEMAEGIFEYWQDFNRRLPRLSPAELAWLSTELDTTDIARQLRPQKTREYSFRQLANLAYQCLPAATDLLATFDTPEQNDHEMFYWTKVASCYHKSVWTIFGHLQSAGLDDPRDKEDGYRLDHSILSDILKEAIPTAMADTMGWTQSKD